MATINDKSCVFNPKNMTTLDAMRGIFSKCKPGCVHTMYKHFNFPLTPEQQKYFLSFPPLPYAECMKYENCQPKCIDQYRNAGTNFSVSEQSKDIVAQQESINQQLSESKNKTYVIVGLGVLAAAALAFFGTRN